MYMYILYVDTYVRVQCSVHIKVFASSLTLWAKFWGGDVPQKLTTITAGVYICLRPLICHAINQAHIS